MRNLRKDLTREENHDKALLYSYQESNVDMLARQPLDIKVNWEGSLPFPLQAAG